MAFFSLFWTLMSTNFRDYHDYACLSCIDHWLCVLHTLPVSACSYIGHASHMHNRCTFAAHTLTLDMFCIHSCQLSLFIPFSTYNMFSCLCHALAYTLLHHPQHVMFTLCFVAFFRYFCLLFELHFIIHIASLMHHLLPLFISSFLSLLPLDSFVYS